MNYFIFFKIAVLLYTGNCCAYQYYYLFQSRDTKLVRLSFGGILDRFDSINPPNKKASTIDFGGMQLKIDMNLKMTK
jgi:hypothetical protein